MRLSWRCKLLASPSRIKKIDSSSLSEAKSPHQGRRAPPWSQCAQGQPSPPGKPEATCLSAPAFVPPTAPQAEVGDRPISASHAPHPAAPVVPPLRSRQRLGFPWTHPPSTVGKATPDTIKDCGPAEEGGGLQPQPLWEAEVSADLRATVTTGVRGGKERSLELGIGRPPILGGFLRLEGRVSAARPVASQEPSAPKAEGRPPGDSLGWGLGRDASLLRRRLSDNKEGL